MALDEKLKPPLGGQSRTINTVLAVSNQGPIQDGQKLLVVGNSSAALVEGAGAVDVSKYDGYDSGSQMLAFCPDGSTLVVQVAPDKVTDDTSSLIAQTSTLALDSLARLGITPRVEIVLADNAHDLVRDVLSDTTNASAVMPLFPSTRLLGEHSAAVAAATFNNKPNFAQIIEELADEDEVIASPVTFVYDDAYDTGFPPIEELVAMARVKGSDALFFKQNVSAGGFGVERVLIDNANEVIAAYQKWVTRMNELRSRGSTEWDFHIQLGVPSPAYLNGEIESPCVVAVIDPDGEGFSVPQILQVSQQRLAHGTHHIGNRVDPEYEGVFISKYKSQLLCVLTRLAQRGVRGHVGLDIVVDQKGTLFFIELNPRLNGNSRIRRLRDFLPHDAVITTNNELVLTETNRQVLEELRRYFYDPNQPDKPSIVITRFPRFIGDAIAFDFINDFNGQLEEGVKRLMTGTYVQ